MLSNNLLILLVVLWSLPWKAIALWKAAKNNQAKWFIVLLLVNTLGILEMFYIFVFSKKKEIIAKEHFTAEEAKKVGEVLGINWSRFDVEQFRKGMDVELEHGWHDPETNLTNDDPNLTGKIALAHLKELPDYYSRLEKMEKEE